MLGVPFPYLAYDMLCDAVDNGKVQDLIFRGGITSQVFVPHFINNEVVRAFQFQGAARDVHGLIQRRAAAWTNSEPEATALVKAWRLCDEAVRNYRVLAWTVTFLSARTLWRRLVRPIVPNQTLLSHEDTCYYRHLEFNVGATDPAWVDHFYKGWGRMLRDDVAYESLQNYDEVILPKLKDAVSILDECDALSETSRDVHDRIYTLHHALTTERNLLEVQEAIHACLADNREYPEQSKHTQRLRAAMAYEIANTREFIELLESSPSTLIPVTSGEETPYMFKAPLTHLLQRKIATMQQHIDDVPGPWFAELNQPGGWTSDLHDRLPSVTL